MFRALPLSLLLLASACSSTHDLKRDGFNVFGGGFIDDKKGPGLYLIKAFSNTSPFATPESAAKTFQLRATELCPSGYKEVRATAAAYKTKSAVSVGTLIDKPTLDIPAPSPVVSSKIGHVLCSDSPLSFYEATMLVTPEGE